jgi:hypothetical protein
VTFPKIELHVHREGTVPTGALLQTAGRNDAPRQAASAAGQPGASSLQCYAADVLGALRDERTRASLQRIGADFARTAMALTREPA